MNNFTKKELITLSLCMNDHVINTKRKLPPSFYKLKNKLQSMIENYCEHKNEEVIWDVNGVVCVDCNETLGII